MDFGHSVHHTQDYVAKKQVVSFNGTYHRSVGVGATLTKYFHSSLVTIFTSPHKVIESVLVQHEELLDDSFVREQHPFNLLWPRYEV
jgi:hypothetical protein